MTIEVTSPDTTVTDAQVTSPAPTRVERALAAVAAKHAETTPEVTPAPQPPSEDHGIHAKALALAQTKEREAYQARQEAKKYQVELDAFKAKEESRKKLNPLELLEQETGLDYAKLTKAIAEKKYAVKTPEQQTLSAHEQELAAMKAKIESYEQEKLTAQEQAVQQQNIEYIRSEIAAKASDYSIISALPGDQAARILQMYRAEWEAQGEEPDLHAVLAQYESATQRDVDLILGSDAVLQKFLATEANKTRVMNLLGLTKQTPQQAQQASQGNRTSLPHAKANSVMTRSEPNSTPSPKSRLERAMAAIADKGE